MKTPKGFWASSVSGVVCSVSFRQGDCGAETATTDRHSGLDAASAAAEFCGTGVPSVELLAQFPFLLDGTAPTPLTGLW